MPRFAFYGRVSTEDQQDPESSRSWQLHRSQQLIEPSGGHIVAEYFDCGHTRSLPWKRRPEASRLLAALRDPERTFTAVVIGEPQRAFYGNQFSLTFPIFTHYGVELWVPEVGGRIDPGSEAHDLVMTLFGGMSKGERTRVKTRVRSAMGAQTATQGRFLGGRPPYGYRLVDAGPHPHPAKAALGGRLHRLEPDPVTAPVVARIFEEYLEGRGYYAIAERLTADGVPSPAGHDRARNPHRHRRAWGKSAVRAILGNPRYTGYQVWGRQPRRSPPGCRRRGRRPYQPPPLEPHHPVDLVGRARPPAAGQPGAVPGGAGPYAPDVPVQAAQGAAWSSGLPAAGSVALQAV
jgi:site-specific DNA recombinase